MKNEPIITEFDFSDENRSGRKGDARRPGRKAKRQASVFDSVVICEFTLIADTREQLGYGFQEMPGENPGEILVAPVISRGLPSGDYSIDGCETAVAIERKSLTDLYGSVTWGRDRFEREIARLNETTYEFAAVVIEASWPEILAPQDFDPTWNNQTNPKSVEGTIIAWSLRYPRVRWMPAGSRRDAEKWTFGVLKRFWEEKHANER